MATVGPNGKNKEPNVEELSIDDIHTLNDFVEKHNAKTVGETHIINLFKNIFHLLESNDICFSSGALVFQNDTNVLFNILTFNKLRIADEYYTCNDPRSVRNKNKSVDIFATSTHLNAFKHKSVIPNACVPEVHHAADLRKILKTYGPKQTKYEIEFTKPVKNLCGECSESPKKTNPDGTPVFSETKRNCLYYPFQAVFKTSKSSSNSSLSNIKEGSKESNTSSNNSKESNTSSKESSSSNGSSSNESSSSNGNTSKKSSSKSVMQLLYVKFESHPTKTAKHVMELLTKTVRKQVNLALNKTAKNRPPLALNYDTRYPPRREDDKICNYREKYYNLDLEFYKIYSTHLAHDLEVFEWYNDTIRTGCEFFVTNNLLILFITRYLATKPTCVALKQNKQYKKRAQEAEAKEIVAQGAVTRMAARRLTRRALKPTKV